MASLKKYRARRDFKKSPEPKGGKPKPSKRPRFVIQQHKGRAMHYDFRIEIDGVLKSWVVPKGPSLNPRDKRLAIPTDDHPLEYARFEGVIPEGHYGAGPVIVWDRGTYRNLKAKGEKPLTMKQSLRRGTIEIFLNGKKLKGGFALIKTADRWLLIKMRDKYADARRKPTKSQPESVKSGKTLREVEREGKK